MKSKYANRGMDFESYINQANQIYDLRGDAVIVKNETKVTVHRSFDRSTGKREISGAHYDEKSGSDYIGVCAGRAIAFEAKETKNKTSFPLSMVQLHQVQFLDHYQRQGGATFLLIRFSLLHEIYLMPFNFFHEYWKAAAAGGRKSIPFQEIKANCLSVGPGGNVAVDYLKPLKTAL
jgi:recombination protein U